MAKSLQSWFTLHGTILSASSIEHLVSSFKAQNPESEALLVLPPL
jgi:hypothetical protein